MAPKAEDRTNEALRTLADMHLPGPMDQRVEAAVDAITHRALVALTAELGGRGAKSKAVRYLLQKGAKAALAERMPQA